MKSSLTNYSNHQRNFFNLFIRGRSYSILCFYCFRFPTNYHQKLLSEELDRSLRFQRRWICAMFFRKAFRQTCTEALLIHSSAYAAGVSRNTDGARRQQSACASFSDNRDRLRYKEKKVSDRFNFKLDTNTSRFTDKKFERNFRKVEFEHSNFQGG